MKKNSRFQYLVAGFSMTALLFLQGCGTAVDRSVQQVEVVQQVEQFQEVTMREQQYVLILMVMEVVQVKVLVQQVM